MLIKETKYCYNDIAIVPAITSNIEHRAECNPCTCKLGGNSLPIFTAPMSTVVNEKNFGIFERNDIIPILPRNIYLKTRLEYLQRGKWVALSLQEFEDLFINDKWKIDDYTSTNVLIDIANGHMTKLHNLIYNAKCKYHWSDKLKIMAGNIANPQTYRELADVGCDLVRFSIGTGNFCITSSNVSVHYPLASLLAETYELKRKMKQAGKFTPLIIADGGIRNYSDVLKSLALGSDYVMIGSEFVKLIESAAPTFYYDGEGKRQEVNPFEDKITSYNGGKFVINEKQNVDKLYKIGYGMASRKGQEDINGRKTKTSEGIEKTLECSMNISKWTENMIAYMQSAMSYTNCLYVADFNPENVDCIIISQQTKQSINL